MAQSPPQSVKVTPEHVCVRIYALPRAERLYLKPEIGEVRGLCGQGDAGPSVRCRAAMTCSAHMISDGMSLSLLATLHCVMPGKGEGAGEAMACFDWLS